MKLTRNVFTIADLNNWLEEKSLRVNQSYQRGRGLWPKNARSYLIDTILNGYPFPKIIIRQTVDLKTKTSIREIVDGQQRMMAIRDFIVDKFVLSSVSKTFKEKKFSDLNEDLRSNFLAYEVSVDTAIGSTQEEVLEIFRRINSYTLPLNEPEKRHATYQGEFKWFMRDIIEAYTPMFEAYEIFTVRQISRMLDADLMTELCQVLLKGVYGRRAKNLDNLYKDNDKNFEEKDIIGDKLRKTLDFIKDELNDICESRILKSYSLYSLFSALVYNKWGIRDISREDVGGLEVIDRYVIDTNVAVQNVLELFMAVDQRDEEGEYGEFVKANIATTHSLANRKIRLKWLIAALQNRL